FNPLHPAVLDVGEYSPEQQQGWESISEGIYEIGFSGEGFSYDNECGRHKVFLEPFSISKSLVTNGEFLEFVRAGGYQNADLWLSDGWEWVNKNLQKHPLYWHEIDGNFQYYTLEGMKALDPDVPVAHVSFYEAAAYAEWVDCR